MGMNHVGWDAHDVLHFRITGFVIESSTFQAWLWNYRVSHTAFGQHKKKKNLFLRWQLWLLDKPLALCSVSSLLDCLNNLGAVEYKTDPAESSWSTHLQPKIIIFFREIGRPEKLEDCTYHEIMAWANPSAVAFILIFVSRWLSGRFQKSNSKTLKGSDS